MNKLDSSIEQGATSLLQLKAKAWDRVCMIEGLKQELAQIQSQIQQAAKLETLKEQKT